MRRGFIASGMSCFKTIRRRPSDSDAVSTCTWSASSNRRSKVWAPMPRCRYSPCSFSALPPLMIRTDAGPIKRCEIEFRSHDHILRKATWIGDAAENMRLRDCRHLSRLPMVSIWFLNIPSSRSLPRKKRRDPLDPLSWVHPRRIRVAHAMRQRELPFPCAEAGKIAREIEQALRDEMAR